ncbi:MAG: GDP-mannose 4,6-dehydratase, partial [Patescibacteria group bacterium]
EQIGQLFKKYKPDICLHAAARAGVRASLTKPFLYSQVNYVGSQVLLEAVRNFSPKTKLVIFSSSSVYGIQNMAPFSETMTANPQSPYGISKYAMELLAKQYSEIYGLKITVIRPFSIYGPRGRLDMAPFLTILAAERGKIFTKFGSSKNNKRDWTYIDDLINGVVSLIEKIPFKQFEIFNLGNSNPIGIDTFISVFQNQIENKLNKKLKIKHSQRSKEELPLTFANINKAKKHFGYDPKISFNEGVELLFADYLIKRKRYKNILNFK